MHSIYHNKANIFAKFNSNCLELSDTSQGHLLGDNYKDWKANNHSYVAKDSTHDGSNIAVQRILELLLGSGDVSRPG